MYFPLFAMVRLMNVSQNRTKSHKTLKPSDKFNKRFIPLIRPPQPDLKPDQQHWENSVFGFNVACECGWLLLSL